MSIIDGASEYWDINTEISADSVQESLKVACVVDIKVFYSFFMDWFYYNLIVLIK